LLEGTPVMATCAAGPNGCTLLSLSREGFASLFDKDVPMRAELCIKVLGADCTLAHVLAHPRGRKIFVELLKTEFADEHIEFYDLVVGFDGVPAEEKGALASRLCEQYVKEGSERQVNIPDGMRKKILAAHADGSLDGLFSDREHDAVHEVYELMSRDNFRRWKSTEGFETFLDSLGAYNLSDRFSTIDMNAIHLTVPGPV